jgi:hypothetical protein
VRLNNGMNKYSTTFAYQNSPNLLPRWQQSSAWCGSDTEELYKANLERRPPGWVWENRPVEYRWNQEGYRCLDWADVDWPNTHAVMGCSHVTGVGVDEKDTITHQLAQQLGEPTVNLGYAGGSCQVIMYNTMRLIELGWLPKTVTIVIPELTRMTYFDEGAPNSLIPHLLNGRHDGILKFYEYWVRAPHHAELYARMAIMGAEALWKTKNVPVIMRHWHHDPKEMQMAPYFDAVKDHARDLQPNGAGDYFGHPGPLTLGLWARDIADSIRLL